MFKVNYIKNFVLSITMKEILSEYLFFLLKKYFIPLYFLYIS